MPRHDNLRSSIAVACLLAALSSEARADAASCPAPIPLGLTTALTGNLALLGTQARNGVEFAVADLNLAAYGRTQIRLAEMARGITTSQVLALQLGRLKDAGTMQPTHVSMAKWNNCRMALDVARDCRDLLGGAGISAEFVPIRHMLNLESVITYEGTETIHQLTIGRALTGLNAF